MAFEESLPTCSDRLKSNYNIKGISKVNQISWLFLEILKTTKKCTVSRYGNSVRHHFEDFRKTRIPTVGSFMFFPTSRLGCYVSQDKHLQKDWGRREAHRFQSWNLQRKCWSWQMLAEPFSFMSWVQLEASTSIKTRQNDITYLCKIVLCIHLHGCRINIANIAIRGHTYISSHSQFAA